MLACLRVLTMHGPTISLPHPPALTERLYEAGQEAEDDGDGYADHYGDSSGIYDCGGNVADCRAIARRLRANGKTER